MTGHLQAAPSCGLDFRHLSWAVPGMAHFLHEQLHVIHAHATFPCPHHVHHAGHVRCKCSSAEPAQDECPWPSLDDLDHLYAGSERSEIAMRRVAREWNDISDIVHASGKLHKSLES